jgi:NAD(P)-dependent dehydrogenase (short-subunit alcohol dehydrogenase family)
MSFNDETTPAGPASRVVVVTGATSGIGLAAAAAFAAAGDTVVATHRGSAPPAALAAAVTAAEGRIHALELDVGNEQSCQGAIESVMSQHGHIDVLVNNAGVGYVATLEQLTIDDLRHSMEVNFFGVARLTKAVLPSMRARRSGRVIAVTSLGGTLGQPFNDAYCAAKFAVEGLFESLYPVEARFGVFTSIVEPGPVATAFRSNSIRPSPGEESEFTELLACYDAIMRGGEGRAQSPEGAAQVIVGVSREERPLLRYQTSNFTTKLASLKLSDLTGEQVTSFTAGWLEAPAQG